MRPEQPQQPGEEVANFVSRLTPEQRMLVVLKRELYGGNWDAMLADLHARLEGRPYVFSLAHRIGDDIRRIDQLRAFEQTNRIDLADYVQLETPAKDAKPTA